MVIRGNMSKAKTMSGITKGSPRLSKSIPLLPRSVNTTGDGSFGGRLMRDKRFRLCRHSNVALPIPGMSKASLRFACERVTNANTSFARLSIGKGIGFGETKACVVGIHITFTRGKSNRHCFKIICGKDIVFRRTESTTAAMRACLSLAGMVGMGTGSAVNVTMFRSDKTAVSMSKGLTGAFLRLGFLKSTCPA